MNGHLGLGEDKSYSLVFCMLLDGGTVLVALPLFILLICCIYNLGGVLICFVYFFRKGHRFSLYMFFILLFIPLFFFQRYLLSINSSF
jgi:hypothetical protein